VTDSPILARLPPDVADDLSKNSLAKEVAAARGPISDALVSLAVIDAAAVTVSIPDLVRATRVFLTACQTRSVQTGGVVKFRLKTYKGEAELEIDGMTSMDDLEGILKQVRRALD